MVEALLTVRVSGFFNFGTELVYRLDSKWRFLRASTFFRFQDFEELHRKVLCFITKTIESVLVIAVAEQCFTVVCVVYESDSIVRVLAVL
jgi:hypothetical protein